MGGYHRLAAEARRAGLVIAATAEDERLRGFCGGFAEQGYEVEAPASIALSDIQAAVSRLIPPVVLLGIAEGAGVGWALACSDVPINAVSLFDPPIEALQLGAPQHPLILHFGVSGEGNVDAATLETLRERLQTVAVYPYAAAPGFIWDPSDAARLARLRTLQLFHRAGGTKGEMGG